jgi:UDP-N-acetylglucosamine 2-epimerase (non-hydrolysing)/GDP/UDP-N,N'-diacetylbacillosamine 2-epimerase (hydrolysing)
MKKKILIITGTRADYGLLRPIIKELKKSRKLQPLVLVTGMHTIGKFGKTVNDILNDNIKPVSVVNISKKDDMLSSLSKEILGINKYCLKSAPNCILVLGDRDEAFAGAIVGVHLGIPVAHVRGGEVTGRVLDEQLRHSITKLSNFHFVSTEKCRQRVLAMGEDAKNVFLTGATEADEIFKKYPSKKEIAKRHNLNSELPWILVVHHPTALDSISLKGQIGPMLNILKNYNNYQKIVIYPNSDTGSKVFINEIEKVRNFKDFKIFKNLPRVDYHAILSRSQVLIGNSSSGIVEAPYFHIPVVNIGYRQEGREHAENVINCGFSMANIDSALEKALSPEFRKKCFHIKSPYGNPGASKNIVKILEKKMDRPVIIWKKFQDRIELTGRRFGDRNHPTVRSKKA